MTNFARDVARQIERRRMRRKMIWWCAIAALVVIAFVYLRCGRGWGIGSGNGNGSGNGSGAVAPADARARCSIRVEANGIVVDEKPMTREQAVAACRTYGAADVVVMGDARHGDWVDLQAALEAAGVKLFVNKP